MDYKDFGVDDLQKAERLSPSLIVFYLDHLLPTPRRQDPNAARLGLHQLPLAALSSTHRTISPIGPADVSITFLSPGHLCRMLEERRRTDSFRGDLFVDHLRGMRPAARLHWLAFVQQSLLATSPNDFWYTTPSTSHYGCHGYPGDSTADRSQRNRNNRWNSYIHDLWHTLIFLPVLRLLNYRSLIQREKAAEQKKEKNAESKNEKEKTDESTPIHTSYDRAVESRDRGDDRLSDQRPYS